MYYARKDLPAVSRTTTLNEVSEIFHRAGRVEFCDLNPTLNTRLILHDRLDLCFLIIVLLEFKVPI